MEKQLVKDTLTTLVREHKNEDGWINLATLGPLLQQNGLNYKELGHYKLTNFIEAHLDVLDIRVDRSFKMPVHFIRLKEGNQKAIEPTRKTLVPKNALTNWAYLKQYHHTIQRLKDYALDERWYYKSQNPEFPFPILSSYLNYTYYKLTQEKGKILSTEDYAVFNTGLVDKRYEPIYAFFQKNDNYTQPWKLVDFCIPGEGRTGKDLVRNFREMPERAHYFDNVSDMLYDTRAGQPELDMKHILLDNAGRLPLHLLSENSPKDFKLKNPDLLSIDDRRVYFNHLAKAIESDTKTYRSLTNRLKDAIALAVKRVQWNFKTAIPMYFPTMNKMSLLLPLSLVDDEIVDIALVTEKTRSGNYIGHTILPLNWAYSNARLVARPDSDWLVADQIEIEKDADDETD